MKEEFAQLEAEIAEHERWLSTALPKAERQSEEHLKLRLRVALHEHWLVDRWKQNPESIRQDLQGVVRTEIEESSRSHLVHAGRTNSRTLRWYAGVGLGLAATLFLGVTLFRTTTDKKAVTVDTDFVVEETAQVADLDSEIDAALEELDDLLALRDDAEWEEILNGL